MVGLWKELGRPPIAYNLQTIQRNALVVEHLKAQSILLNRFGVVFGGLWKKGCDPPVASILQTTQHNNTKLLPTWLSSIWKLKDLGKHVWSGFDGL